MSEIDLNAYLDRIHYQGNLTPTIQTLIALQEAHLLSVPFENLSIHIDEPIELADTLLFEKVVNRRRGGFCYELNGLFSVLLRSLGFDVEMISASVSRGDGEYTPDFAHMALMVTLDDRWLVDVGFGDTFRRPLRIDDLNDQVQTGAAYRIVPYERFHTLMERKDRGEWKPQYRFRLTPYKYTDFAEMCHFQQYSPDSHFRQGRLCSMATPDGRITLSELNFIKTWLDGRREETVLDSEKAFVQILQGEFGIDLKQQTTH